MFIGRTDAPILWSQLIGKDLDARQDGGQEKGTTGDEMVGWRHRLNGQEFEQAPGGGEGQGGLAGCHPWDQEVRKDLVTEQRQQFKGPGVSPRPP